MRKEIFPFESEEKWLELRKHDITSTQMAALFGCSKYLTPFELWHIKKNNQLDQFEESERTKWGKRLQESIARGIAEDEGIEIDPKTEYIRLLDHRMGSSFDYAIRGGGLAEVKNVDKSIFYEEWIVDGENIEATPDIEIQVQHELCVSGEPFAWIWALVGGNKPVLIKRLPDKALHEKMFLKCDEFFDSIEKNIEPEPDFERDAKFIAKLYSHADKEKTSAADDEIEGLAAHYKIQQNAEKEAKKQKEIIKAKILVAVGDTAKVLGSNFSISLSTIADTPIEAYTRKAYRNFKVNFKGEKPDGE